MPRRKSDARRHKKKSQGTSSGVETFSAGSSSDSNVAGPHVEKGRTLEDLKEKVCTSIREIVSQNRRRIKTDGFDLDLTYITDRIIAMGYPANATEALYRNSMSMTIKFLEQRHKNHYKVFNLRGQYTYDPANFKNRVISFEMTDHHPPRLELMAPFCREVHEWLMEDPKNVVAVHCKAGKGRTGVMICAYLSYCRFYPSPRQNMDYYSVVRTRNNKGVTIPSQRRYVYYYSHLRRHELNYFPLRVQLVGVYVERFCKHKGPMRDQLSVRVANGDVDVFHGACMNVSDDIWLEEEEAWSGNAISAGPDAYDPNLTGDYSPRRSCISRRAFGWTVSANKPVFLEGDVRIDLYSNRRVLPMLGGRSKLGHIWFNTMFCCPAACGGDPYVHGDEAHPYPEGGTTIAERKTKFKVGCEECDDEGEELVCNGHAQAKLDGCTSDQDFSFTNPHSEDTGPLARSTQSKSSPVLSPTKSVGAASTGKPRTSPNTKDDQKEKPASRKTSRFTNFTNKFFNDPTKARSSEPTIQQVQSSRSHRQSHPSSASAATSPTLSCAMAELQICDPPGLETHCPKESLKKIYEENKKVPPRYAINKMLKDAHEKNLVQDVYNERRKSVPCGLLKLSDILYGILSEGDPVRCAPTGRPEAGGPNRIERQPDEHVNVFPVMEIDRACKNETLSNGFKLIVVTRCINTEMARHCEAFTKVTFEKQNRSYDEKFTKVHKDKPRPSDEERNAFSGAVKAWPPVIQYGNRGMCSGGEADSLSDLIFKDDERAKDERYCRYFHKQREDSPSRYPEQVHLCPLLSEITKEESSETVMNSSTSAHLAMDDAAVDENVRSYHPDQWNDGHSASSQSSSSIQSDADDPNQSCAGATTDASGLETTFPASTDDVDTRTSTEDVTIPDQPPPPPPNVPPPIE